jgi:hypothetical protein
VTIANAKPSRMSGLVIRFAERQLGATLTPRQRQILTALFDPEVGPQVEDALLGAEPGTSVKFATCRRCRTTRQVKKDGLLRRHTSWPSKDILCPGSNTRDWTT